MSQTGQCLCGAVRFRIAEVAEDIHVCHCTDCQRWTGGGPLYAVRVSGVEIEGKDQINTYAHSAHGERATCSTCGSTLFWKMAKRDIAYLALGVLDDRGGKTVSEEIFTDQRPAWLPAAEGASQAIAAEMKAQLDAFLKKGTNP